MELNIMITLFLDCGSVDYDYDTIEGTCDEDDICRNSKIANVRFECRYSHRILRDILTNPKNEDFRNYTKINKLFLDKQTLPTEIVILIDSIFESTDFYNTIRIEPCIKSGYYGEEIDRLEVNVHELMMNYLKSIIEILIEKGINAAIVESFSYLALPNDLNIFIGNVDAANLKRQCRAGNAIASKSSGSYSEEYPFGIVLKTHKGYKILSGRNRISESVLFDHKPEIKLMVVEIKNEQGNIQQDQTKILARV